jgi:hypothetical protein
MKMNAKSEASIRDAARYFSRRDLVAIINAIGPQSVASGMTESPVE